MSIVAAAFGRHDELLLTPSGGRSITWWRWRAGGTSVRIEVPALLRPPELSDSGARVLTVDAGAAREWDPATGRLVTSLHAELPNVVGAHLDHRGDRIVTWSADGAMSIWNADTGVKLADLIGHGGPVYDAEFDHDGTNVVSASSDGTARVWRPLTAAATLPARHILGIDLSPDGRVRRDLLGGRPRHRVGPGAQRADQDVAGPAARAAAVDRVRPGRALARDHHARPARWAGLDLAMDVATPAHGKLRRHGAGASSTSSPVPASARAADSWSPPAPMAWPGSTNSRRARWWRSAGASTDSPTRRSIRRTSACW